MFDLNTDPTEQHNLVELNPQMLAELSQLRQELMAEQQAEPIWKGALTSPVKIDEHIKEEFNTEEDEYIYWTN